MVYEIPTSIIFFSFYDNILQIKQTNDHINVRRKKKETNKLNSDVAPVLIVQRTEQNRIVWYSQGNNCNASIVLQ